MHYICTGSCNGVSEEPVDCGSASCENYGNALIECNCTDGEHGRHESQESDQ